MYRIKTNEELTREFGEEWRLLDRLYFNSGSRFEKEGILGRELPTDVAERILSGQDPWAHVNRMSYPDIPGSHFMIHKDLIIEEALIDF
jgi:hypothetical protein